MAELIDLNTLRTVADLAAHQADVRTRITAMHTASNGLPFTDEQREEFAALRKQDVECGTRIQELETREDLVRQYAARDADRGHREGPDDLFRQTEARGSNREQNIYDLSTVRYDWGNPGGAHDEFRDRALRAIEATTFLGGDKSKAHVETLLREHDTEDGALARRILLTGSPAYRRAFAKKVTGRNLAADEERALVVGGSVADSAGFAVPITIDPTLIRTSNLSVNPWRAICAQETIVGTEWRGVTAGAVVAAYAAEGTETDDNAPTLTQPEMRVVRAQAFIPFSIEAGQDWGALQSEIGRSLQEAKDDLEAAKFFDGNGTNQPTGLNSMSGATDVSTAVGGAFAVGDLTKLESNLAPRFRSRATFVGNRFVYNKVRAFPATDTGFLVWRQLGQGLPNQVPTPGALDTALLGYPTYEASAMLATLSGGSRILCLGDFRYYKIVDRVGMTVEVIPQLFGTARNFPTGQRGLYAIWRNNGMPLSEAAFRFLKT